ncbi:ORF6N domain-containing protein [Aequorivita viscosa]|nr:ORF6N domain-containing protein [Aequorivita viscosa]
MIRNKIFLVRGQKVMLDKDLVELYDVKNIRLRELVKRNLYIRFLPYK